MNVVSQDPVDVLKRYFPILIWGAEYSRRTLVNDMVVAAIVTIMLIPQREAEKEAKTGI